MARDRFACLRWGVALCGLLWFGVGVAVLIHLGAV